MLWGQLAGHGRNRELYWNPGERTGKRSIGNSGAGCLGGGTDRGCHGGAMGARMVGFKADEMRDQTMSMIKSVFKGLVVAAAVGAGAAFATAPTIDTTVITDTLTAGLAAITAVAGAKFGVNALKFIYRKVFGG